MLRLAVARSSSDDSGIRYVLPVLWMTSRAVGNIDVGRRAEASTQHFQRICRWAPQCLTLSSYKLYSGSKLRTGGEVWCLRLPCWEVHKTLL